MPRGAVGAAALLLGLAPLGCGAGASAVQGCLPGSEPTALPQGLEESSGAAVSRYHPELFWTHNDGGNGRWLYAVGFDGQERGAVRVSNARNRDWEDMELAPCAEGSCLYIGDVGDNYLRWNEALVHRFPEPAPGDSAVEVTTLSARYPDGPQDTEALFVLPGERVHLITKGSNGPVAIYRFPDPGQPGPAVLQRVQVLDPERRALPRQVTGASASPSGEHVAVRTYETLEFYRVDGDTLVHEPGRRVNLRPLAESQGEAVAWGPGGQLVLTSEQGPFGSVGSFTLLTCTDAD
jgi:hypothetical protein